MTATGRLTCGEDGAGPRYSLRGEPVHAGTELEVVLGDNHWAPVRFETKGHKAVFWFRSLGAEDPARLCLPDDAVLQ